MLWYLINMSTLITSFRNMTLRDTVNSLSGLLYALRHSNLQGMTNQQRRTQIRQLQMGAGLLGMAIFERSYGAAAGAVSNMTGPATNLTKSGSRTQLSQGQDWGMVTAGKLASACLFAIMQFGTPANAAHDMPLDNAVVERHAVSEQPDQKWPKLKI